MRITTATKSRLRSPILIASLLAWTGPAYAQEQDLRSAMSSRVVDLTATEGAAPQYDAGGSVKAGYFRLRVEPKGLQSATICPDAVRDRLSKTEREKWNAFGGAVADVVFKRNYLWGMDATVVLRPGTSSTAPETASVTLSLITIKDPKHGNCEIKIGGVTGAANVDYESFLVPLGSGPANYSDRIQVDLKSGYSSVTDKKRIAQLWDGLVKPVTAAIFAPAAAVVGAVSDQAQAAIIQELSRNIIAGYPESFTADPGPGQKARKIFLKLDFINLPGPGGVPAVATGGITIALEYQASVFLKNASFYRDIIDTPATLLQTVVRTSSGDKAIGSLLPATSYNQLRYTAATPELFNGGCATVRDELVKLGLSSVDASVFLWATASENPNALVRDKLWEIGCIKTAANDLSKVGIKPPPVPTPPPGRRATLAEMYSAMDNLATMMQLNRLNGDLAKRFAPKITLIVDDRARSLLALDELVVELDKDVALQLLAQKFTRLGCYAPRSSNPELTLPMRPAYPPALNPTERASAAIALLGGLEGLEGEPFLVSFKYGPVVDPEVPQINAVSIAARGSDIGPVVREVTENRRPVSCNESWMNPVFIK